MLLLTGALWYSEKVCYYCLDGGYTHCCGSGLHSHSPVEIVPDDRDQFQSNLPELLEFERHSIQEREDDFVFSQRTDGWYDRFCEEESTGAWLRDPCSAHHYSSLVYINAFSLSGESPPIAVSDQYSERDAIAFSRRQIRYLLIMPHFCKNFHRLSVKLRSMNDLASRDPLWKRV